MGSNQVEPRDSALRSNRMKRRLMFADVAAAVGGLLIAFVLQAIVRPVPHDIILNHILLSLVGLPAFAVGAGWNQLYRARANHRPSEELHNLARTVAFGVGVMVLISFALQYKATSRLWMMLVFAAVLTALAAERAVARRIFSRMRADGRMRRRIVIVGTDGHAVGLLHTYERNPALGYQVVGFVGDDDLGERCGVGVLGPISDLHALLVAHEAVGVVVSLRSVDPDHVNVLVRRLTDDGYHVALSSCLADIDVTRLRPQELAGRTMVYVEPVIRGGWRALAKRMFDVLVAATIIVLSLPLWLVATIAIKVESSGPVFFRQQRVGRDGAVFTMTKFRTMDADAEQRRNELAGFNEVDGPLFKIADDPRVTRVGRVLRKLSIDELPQLISVLKGTMSMVGPRPALPDEAEQWDAALAERLRVPPGLTGMWQVSGRSGANFDTYRRMDLYYVHNWSLAHDLRICARTIGVVLTGRGAA